MMPSSTNTGHSYNTEIGTATEMALPTLVLQQLPKLSLGPLRRQAPALHARDLGLVLRKPMTLWYQLAIQL